MTCSRHVLVAVAAPAVPVLFAVAAVMTVLVAVDTRDSDAARPDYVRLLHLIVYRSWGAVQSRRSTVIGSSIGDGSCEKIAVAICFGVIRCCLSGLLNEALCGLDMSWHQ